MTRKTRTRMGSAFLSGAQEGQNNIAPTPETLPSGGNWSRMAIKEMEKSLATARDDLEQARDLQYQGILSGELPLRVPADQIEDAIGTDRITRRPDDPDDTSSFESLKENIRRRGQREPIRLRPVDPGWRPAQDAPRDVVGQKFYLQSGRRRLQACRELGIDPIAFLSFSSADEALLEDLQERFFENAARQDLTIAEKLYSIGLIARETEGTTQAQIAEFLGVSVAQVSRGLAFVSYHDRLTQDLDLTTASRDQIDRQLKIYREEKLSTDPRAVHMRRSRAETRTALPFSEKTTPIGRLTLRQKGSRRSLTLSGPGLDDATIEKLVAMIESLADET